MRGFAMTRSMLLSVTVIGAVLAVFATASTFAAFTTSDSDSGTVTAGDVEIDVHGTDNPGLVFNDPIASCPSPMAPGDSCTATVTVENIGSLPVQLIPDPPTASVVTSESLVPAGCTDGDWSAVASFFDDAFLDPGDIANFTVTVTLDALANNGCQGETATVTVTVDAEST